jgi:hypothetical protein
MVSQYFYDSCWRTILTCSSLKCTVTVSENLCCKHHKLRYLLQVQAVVFLTSFACSLPHISMEFSNNPNPANALFVWSSNCIACYVVFCKFSVRHLRCVTIKMDNIVYNQQSKHNNFYYCTVLYNKLHNYRVRHKSVNTPLSHERLVIRTWLAVYGGWG